jgi:hypothetical protein
MKEEPEGKLGYRQRTLLSLKCGRRELMRAHTNHGDAASHIIKIMEKRSRRSRVEKGEERGEIKKET